jgi:23S rRNA (uracil1939-C5)-methyltransferase
MTSAPELAPGPRSLDCPHFPPCPGCPLIPVAYAAQLAEKQAELAAALAPVIPAERLRPLVPSPILAGYRNQSRLVFARGPERRVELGLYEARTHHVVPIPRCPIQPEGMNALARAVGKAARELRLTVYDERTGRGILRYLALRTDHARRRYLVGIVAAQGDDPRLEMLATGLRTNHPEIAGMTLHLNPHPGNVIFAGHDAWTAGEARLPDRIGRAAILVSVQSFLQANHAIAGAIAERIAEHLAPVSGVICDLYGGVGVIAFHLAGPARLVIGVESAPVAVADAEAALAAHRLAAGAGGESPAIEFVTARVEDFLADPGAHVPAIGGRPIAAAVVNPPRAGLSAAARSALLESAPARIAYVSCRPQSLARDLVALAEHYDVEEVTGYDMLPLTRHIEALAFLVRRDALPDS